MADLSRIEHLIKAIKDAEALCLRNQIPLTIDEKLGLIEESSNLHNVIMHNVQVQKICSNCEHCVFWEGKHCCSARDMAPIPFEVQNRVGGCSKWYEKDFLPF